ncbi:hypothetical protein VZ95_00145 [Elstera litoralis]|uniref:Uncharacterized protein n=1 Tax=Elstera litoralis TaxID=552518 RepID=A0A0F3IXA7_9PROT|nr:hypothetical protein [Elstera litoralis]KJV11168.1 hypothetical protein VZ95_00145 [Elstera litoralis]
MAVSAPPDAEDFRYGFTLYPVERDYHYPANHAGVGLLILLIAVLGLLSWAALEKVSDNLRHVKRIAETSTAAA